MQISKSTSISTLYPVEKGLNALETTLDNIVKDTLKALEQGSNIIILSDRGTNSEMAPMPMLLACAHLHNALKKHSRRSDFGIIIESAEPREPHHFALLLDTVPVLSTPTWSMR